MAGIENHFQRQFGKSTSTVLNLYIAYSRLPDSRGNENNCVGKASGESPTHFSHAFFFLFPYYLGAWNRLTYTRLKMKHIPDPPLDQCRRGEGWSTTEWG